MKENPTDARFGATGRTNKHFNLKENPLKRSDLDDLVACYIEKIATNEKKAKAFPMPEAHAPC